MKRTLLPILCLFISSFSFAQNIIDFGANNPTLIGEPVISMAQIIDDQIFIGGNINFVNNQVTSPFVKLNTDGSLEPSFNPALIYSNNFNNDLLGFSATIMNGNIYYIEDYEVQKINSDGTRSNNFQSTNFVRSFIGINDSILVLDGNNKLINYAEDGNSRTIEFELANDYILEKLFLLSDESFLIRMTNKESGINSIVRINSDFTLDDSFNPLITESGFINKVQLLANGNIFINSLYNLNVNTVSGNGMFLINPQGEIASNSPHQSDLSYIDANNLEGVAYALPLENGQILATGISESGNYLLVRLNSDGSRDDTFIASDFSVSDNNRPIFMIKNANEDIFIIANQKTFNSLPSPGINKISLDGENQSDFSVELGGTSFVYDIQEFTNDDFLISGEFTSSILSDNPFISVFNYKNNSPAFPWLETNDLINDDLFGKAKVLSNGGLLIGAFDRGENSLFRVFDKDGNKLAFTPNQINPVSAQRSVYNLHESNDYIYATGRFMYNTSGQSQFSIARFNKDYTVDESYKPAKGNGDETVVYSYLTGDEKIIAQYYNYTAATDSIIKLMPDGSRDESFNSISYGEPIYGSSFTRIVDDSLIISLRHDFNNPQTVSLYNIEGELLNDNLFSINASADIFDIDMLSDSIIIVAGSFNTLNNIPKTGIALVNLNGAVYDDFDFLNATTIQQTIKKGDTLYVAGNARMDNQNLGGFFGISLETNAVDILTTLVTDSGTVQITWAEETNIRSYEIIRIDNSGNEVLLAKLDKRATTYEDKDPKVNTAYTYKIVSKNLFGINEASALIELIQPQTPSELSLIFNNGNNELSWLDNSDSEIGFNIFRKMDEGDYSLIADIDANTLTYTDKAVELNHTYSYYLIATSENYYSEKSDTASLAIFLPSEPTEVSYEFDRENMLFDIFWMGADGQENDYIVFESIDGNSFRAIDTLSALTIRKNLNNFENEYQYYIKAKNQFGQSQPSETIAIDTKILHISDAASGLKVYPNPSHDYFTIEINSEEIESIKIINLKGEIIQSYTGSTLKKKDDFKVNGLTPGLYIIHFMNHNQELFKTKIIIK